MADGPRPPPLAGSLPSSFDGNEEFYNENQRQKIFRKIKEEPLVPIGMLLTSFAFVGAYRALRRGDSQQANRMFRARVLAQGLTVVAMVAGSMYYSQDREKTKELRKLKEEKDAEEKRSKWIKELEIRDEEDKKMREKMLQRVQQKQQAAQEAVSGTEGGDAPGAAGSGGVLGKMGLWSKAEQKANVLGEKVEELKDEVEKKTRKENPKSSLRDLGEIYGRKKPDDGSDDGSNKK